MTLGAVCELIADGTHGSPARVEDGIPVLSAANVRQGGLSYDTDRFTTAAEHQTFARRVTPRVGDVLLTIVGTIGRAALMPDDRPVVFQRSVAIIRPTPRLLFGRYLLHAVQTPSFRDQLRAATNQSSQAGVYLKRLRELTIPLPSLEEQRRIAEILDQADALLAKRRQSLALLDQLTQSIFHDMFGDPLTNERGWERTPLGAVGCVTTGNTPSREEPANFGGSIDWVKSDDLGHGVHVARSRERLSEVGASRARLVPKGAVLVTCIAGTPASIGTASVADRTVAFNQQINAIEPSGADSYFLYGLFLCGKPLVQAASTGGMKGLVSKSRFQAIEVITPPLELQQEFGQRLRCLESQRGTLSAGQDLVVQLASSLRQRAFAGLL